MTNKELVLKFYEEVFNGWDVSKVPLYMREDYRQHNPTVEDGREGFLKFCERFLAMKPHMEISLCAADGDVVMIFFKCTFEAHDHVAKVCDIYRVQDGMLAEHWDVLQSVDPEKTPVNPNGEF